MATLANKNPTLMDHARAFGPDGAIMTVVEMLNQTNEMLADMTFIEGNLPTGHKHAVRTGLPKATWRQLYQGVQPDKSTRAQVTDTTGMLEAYAEIDKALADLANSTAEFRMQEAKAFLESMSQDLQQTAIFGDTRINPERFMGLAPRYNDLNAQNSDNIIDGGGTGTDNASIWLICWGTDTCHGIIPKGSSAGIQVNDKGQVTIENVDGAGGRMEAYRTHFRLDAGLAVPDWRYVVRICNIDRSLLTADASAGANLPELMFEAMERIPDMNGDKRMSFYMDRSVRTKFRQQLANATKQSTLEYQNVGGIKSPVFNEVPIRRVDRLAVDEARVIGL